MEPTWISDCGRVTLYLGDCLAIAPKLEGIDVIISDPPYGIAHVKGTGGKGKHTRRNIKAIEGDDKPFDPSPWLAYENVLIWGADHYAQRLPRGRWLVWDKLEGLEGATVLDPYMGSGSTIIAAIRTRRKAIGIEKDPEHFANALERIKQELAQPELFQFIPPQPEQPEQPELL